MLPMLFRVSKYFVAYTKLCHCVSGDAVYLSSPGEDNPRIIRIDKLWTNPK